MFSEPFNRSRVIITVSYVTLQWCATVGKGLNTVVFNNKHNQNNYKKITGHALYGIAMVKVYAERANSRYTDAGEESCYSNFY